MSGKDGVSGVTGPSVSILLPYRNCADTLEESLQSILAQSLYDYEVIAIDDHSSDGSTGIAKACVQTDPRFRILHNDGRGLVNALNYGISLARSEFIARMDADDRMHPDRLLVQLQHMRSHPHLALVASRVNLFSEKPLGKGISEYIRWQNNCVTAEDIAAELYIESPFVHPSVMFRRSEVSRLGGYRQGDFPEDYDLWLRMYQAGLRMEKIPRILLDWRDSSGRLTRTDKRCADTAFSALRAEFLVRDPRLPLNRPVFFWGAGRRTRQRCRFYIERGIEPQAWIDIDPAKIGNYIKGVPVLAAEALQNLEPRPFVLGFVRNHGARECIAAFLNRAHYKRVDDYLFIG